MSLKPHSELREALDFIADSLPPMGMTSIPEEPTKPAEANALHDAKRRAYRALNSLVEQLETAQLGDKMRDDGEHALLSEVEARDAYIKKLQEQFEALTLENERLAELAAGEINESLWGDKKRLEEQLDTAVAQIRGLHAYTASQAGGGPCVCEWCARPKEPA